MGMSNTAGRLASGGLSRWWGSAPWGAGGASATAFTVASVNFQQDFRPVPTGLAVVCPWMKLGAFASRSGLMTRNSKQRRPRRSGVTFALALWLCATAVQAQTGSLRGTVTDSQRGVVADAAVSLESAGRDVRSTRSAADGTFSFEGVVAGDYTLQVESPGFALQRQPVSVTDGPVAVDVVMDVAGLAEAVSVTAPAAVALTEPAVTGSRLGMSMLETPASVHVVSGATVRERGDASLAQAKSRMVGVATQANPGNGGGSVSARGFGGTGSVMQLFDGEQFFVGAGTVTFPFDPWTVDRIEVLGGPASVLYGTGAIGGVINVVPRRPNTERQENAVRLVAGSYNTWRAAVDSSGPINDRAAYRVDLSHNQARGWLDHGGEMSSTALSASLRFDLTPDLTLTLSEDYGLQQPELYWGTPSVDGRLDESLRETNYNVGDGRIRYEDNWTQMRLEWQPSDGVRVRTGGHYLRTDRHWRNLENYLIDPAARTVFREFYLEILHDQRQYGHRTDAVIDRPLLGRPNTFSVGFDYTLIRFQHTNNSPYGGTSVVDLVNPEPGRFLNIAGTFPKYRTDTHRVAAFAENRLEVTPSVSLVGGFRVDRYDVAREELVRDATAEGLYNPVSWRGGVVYAVRPDLSLYGQYSTATDVIGNVISNTATRLALAPTVGRQVEAGVKQSFLDDRGQWTVAGYYIVKDNLLAPDPLNPGTTLQIGAQSSRGVEATLGLALPSGVGLDASVALLDARYDEFAQRVGDMLVSRNGNTPRNIPEQLFNLWLTWNAPGGWQFRGGVQHVGDRFWNHANSGTVPGYTVVDAGLRRQLSQNVDLDVRVNNLFDELYATTYYSNVEPQWFLGMPRSAEVAFLVGF